MVLSFDEGEKRDKVYHYELTETVVSVILKLNLNLEGFGHL